MRPLFLGPADSPLIPWLREREGHVGQTAAPVHGASPVLADHDFLVSYGYRHILRPDVLARFDERAVNLHISYLPWNRGADPNLWSFLDDTPKGVTIHYLDAGVDTGDVIVQRHVEPSPDDTLATSYSRLTEAIEALFREWWPRIRDGRCPRTPQGGPGTAHRAADKQRFAHLLTGGWDTPVAAVRGAAQRPTAT